MQEQELDRVDLFSPRWKPVSNLSLLQLEDDMLPFIIGILGCSCNLSSY